MKNLLAVAAAGLAFAAVATTAQAQGGAPAPTPAPAQGGAPAAAAPAQGGGAAVTAAPGGGNLASQATQIQIDMNGRSMTMTPAEIELTTGKYYRLTVTSDGVEEFMFRAPDLWRNAWINQITINDIEVHAYGGIYGVEFDAAGEAVIFFVPLRPGDYDFFVPGQEERGLRGTFVVR